MLNCAPEIFKVEWRGKKRWGRFFFKKNLKGSKTKIFDILFYIMIHGIVPFSKYAF